MTVKLFTPVALSSLMLIAAAPAMAQTGDTGFNPWSAYGTLGYNQYDQSAGSNLGALTGRLGLRYGRYVGAEVEGAFGVDNDTYLRGTAKADVDLTRSVAAYAVGYIPVMPRLDLFARVGLGNNEFHTTTPLSDIHNQRDTVNYGGGAQYFFTAHDGLRGEYTRESYSEGPGYADVWGVSYIRKF
jgi:outer membrane immunogenic protein